MHWLATLRAALIARGTDAFSAKQQSYAVLARQLQRQAMMLSFVDTFWILAAVFACLMPLVFLMKMPEGRGAPIAAH